MHDMQSGNESHVVGCDGADEEIFLPQVQVFVYCV